MENVILLIRVILFRLTNFIFLLKTRPHKVCSCCRLIYPLGSTFLFPLCVHFHLWKGYSERIRYGDMSPHTEPQLWKERGPWLPWASVLCSSIYKQNLSSQAKSVLLFSLQTLTMILLFLLYKLKFSSNMQFCILFSKTTYILVLYLRSLAFRRKVSSSTCPSWCKSCESAQYRISGPTHFI